MISKLPSRIIYGIITLFKNNILCVVRMLYEHEYAQLGTQLPTCQHN